MSPLVRSWQPVISRIDIYMICNGFKSWPGSENFEKAGGLL